PARAAIPLRPAADRSRDRSGSRARPQHRRGAGLRDHRVAWTADVDSGSRGTCLLHRPGRGPALFRRLSRALPKAVRDLIQLANRVPTSIVLVSCLGDFYGKVRETLTQSYVDRIEKAGPVPLIETRTAEEARLIIAKRLNGEGGNGLPGEPSTYFGPQFHEEFGGLTTRRILELAQARLRADAAD